MVQSLKRLADREAGQILVFGHLLLNIRYFRQRRPLPQPGTQRLKRLTRPASQDLNIAAIEVDRVARDAKLLSLAPSTVTKPDSLDSTPNPDPSGLC